MKFTLCTRSKYGFFYSFSFLSVVYRCCVSLSFFFPILASYFFLSILVDLFVGFYLILSSWAYHSSQSGFFCRENVCEIALACVGNGNVKMG